MMKEFFNKISAKLPLIRKIALISLAGIWLATVGAIFLTSYLEYKAYYDEMIAIKEQIDAANRPSVTTLNGIEIQLVDGAGFYDNGKANPIKGHFVVTAHFDIDGREYDEELSEYTLTVPEDFAENGGTITATYNYTYTKEVDAPVLDADDNPVLDDDGTPLTEKVEKEFTDTYTATIDIQLEEVKPKALQIVENPYLVVYKEGQTFSKEGMKVRVIYNDGSVHDDVDISDVAFDGAELTTEVKKVSINYVHDGVKVFGDVPVKVMTASEFTHGNVLEIIVDDCVVNAGQSLITATPTVRVKYDSGNIVKASDGEFEIKADDVIAQIGDHYKVMVELTENRLVKKLANVAVASKTEAENATLNNAQTLTAGSATVVGSFAEGSSLTQTLNAKAGTYVSIYANMSNGYIVQENGKYVAKALSINDVIKVSINGKLRALANTKMPYAGPFNTAQDALGDLRRVYIGDFYLNAGDNTVEIAFRSSIEGYLNYQNGEPYGFVDKFEIVSYDDTPIISTFGEYVSTVDTDLTVENHSGWGSIGGVVWQQSSTTDGKYIYFIGMNGGASTAITSADGTTVGWKKSVRIIKYDPETNTALGYSKNFDAPAASQWQFGTYMSIFYKDGYVYSYNSDLQPVRIAVSALESSGANSVEITTDVKIEGAGVKAVTYEGVRQKYAVLVGSGISVYDKNQQLEYAFNIKNSATAKVSAYDMHANATHVYVLYQADGVYVPVVQVYDWEGNLIKEVNVPNTLDIMGMTGTSYNVQTIVEVGDTLYFSMVRWTNGSNGAIFKASFEGKAIVQKQKLTLGEYVEECNAQGATLTYTSETLGGAPISGLTPYVHGFCTDGTYAYATANNGKNTRIYKIDLATGKAVGSTGIFQRNHESNNGEYLYHKDGYIYVILLDGNGTVARVACDSIDETGSAEVKTVAAPFTVQGLLHAATYNATQNKYAVISTKDGTTRLVRFIDAKTKAELAKVEVALSKPTNITCDENYVYVFYENGVGTAGIKIYDWAGNLVSTTSMPGIFDAKATNNVQGMAVVDGNLYFIICTWAKTETSAGAAVSAGTYITKVKLDQSIIGK